jgi:AcrR family transcriptional regulator
MMPRAYRSPRRDAAAEATRQRIIRAASDLFAAGKPFSMEAVAKRARVTRVTIYHQFASKANLLEAVFDEVAAAGGLKALPQIFGMPDARRALRELVHVFVNFWQMHRRTLPRLSAAIVDADIQELLRGRIERRRKGLAAIIKRLLGPAADPVRSRDLIDVLFALTSADFFELLAVHDRQPSEIEALVIEAVEAVVSRYADR